MSERRACKDDFRPAPLNSILEALGEEFCELGRFTEEFQSTLSPALLQVAGNAQCHRDVQSLDLLSQRLTALSKYVLTIGKLLPADWEVNSQHALSNITLSDLQYRLKGAPLPENLEHESGELELF
jgi:hypothetical protein